MQVKKLIIYFILLLALPLFSWGSKFSSPEDSLITIDTTQCPGYSFFISKGIQLDSCSDLKLYNEVYSWLGVPYRYGGRSKKGADCSGFASMVYKYVYDINVSGSAGGIYKMLKSVEKSDLQEGDLVFFKINRSYISHVGVYLSNNKFIHATSYGKTVTVSDLDEPYYKKYYFSAGRYL